MNNNTLNNIKEALSDEKKIYKFPTVETDGFDSVLGALKSSSLNLLALNPISLSISIVNPADFNVFCFKS